MLPKPYTQKTKKDKPNEKIETLGYPFPFLGKKADFEEDEEKSR